MLASLKLTVITEPAVVVAMAAALASEGAAMPEKLTDVNVAAAVVPPPQAVSEKLASAVDSGNKGAPASACSRERRENWVVFDMDHQKVELTGKSRSL